MIFQHVLFDRGVNTAKFTPQFRRDRTGILKNQSCKDILCTISSSNSRSKSPSVPDLDLLFILRLDSLLGILGPMTFSTTSFVGVTCTFSLFGPKFGCCGESMTFHPVCSP